MTGARIRKARRAAGISAAQLGDLVGVTETSVLRWERDEVAASVETLLAIGDALGLRLEIEFRPLPHAATQAHYLGLLGDAEGVGVQLLARALWRVRHPGQPDDRDAIRDILIELRSEHGEVVERDDAIDIIKRG